MATWQQGINSGGFLAGIGGQNSNAPKASDVSEALAYIRQNNEMERSGRNNIGLQALQGLGSVAQTYQAAKQQEADAAFQKEYAAAIQSGDRQQVRDLMTKYPGQLEKIQSGMKWADEDQRDEIGNLAAGGQIASMMGGDAFSKWIGNNATRLSNQGVDPQQLLSMYQKDPQATSQLIGQYGQFALGHEKYWDLQDKMAGREIDRGKLAETIRNNDMTSARGWAGLNQTARFHADDMEMKRLNYQNTLLENQYKATDNDLKRQELQQKIDANKQIIHAKADASLESIDRLNQAMGVADDLESLIKAHPTAVSRNQGGILGKFWNLTDDTQTLASKTEELNMKLILPMLRGTFGANPTEGEREALKASANNLSNAKSEADYMKELVRVRNIATRLKNREQVKLKSFGADDYIRQQQQAADTGSQAATKYLPRRNTPSASQPASNEELASKYGL